MKEVTCDDLIEGEYYLTYFRTSSKSVGIGIYNKQTFCLLNAISYNQINSYNQISDKFLLEVFVIHPKWLGINTRMIIFKLDKNEILRHIVSEEL